MPLLPVTPPTYAQPPVMVGGTRIIEDKGIYFITDDELNAWQLRILVDVIVLPPIVYKSFKPNEPEQYFGAFQIVEGGFIISQANLKFEHQQVFRWRNDAAKALFDAYQGFTLAAINTFNAAVAVLNSIPASAGLTYNEPPRLKHLVCPATEIWFRVVPGCKIAVHTEYLPLPQLNGSPASIPEPAQGDSPSAPDHAGGNGKPPDDAPARRPANPPYDPETNDGNHTTPPGNPQPTGMWIWTVDAVFQSCEGDSYTIPIPAATNPYIQPVFVPQTTNAACPNAKDGILKQGGITIGAPTGVIGVGSWSYQ